MKTNLNKLEEKNQGFLQQHWIKKTKEAIWKDIDGLKGYYETIISDKCVSKKEIKQLLTFPQITTRDKGAVGSSPTGDSEGNHSPQREGAASDKQTAPDEVDTSTNCECHDLDVSCCKSKDTSTNQSPHGEISSKKAKVLIGKHADDTSTKCHECIKCGREYDGKYPCPCGSRKFKKAVKT